jgi:hypothetical protein
MGWWAGLPPRTKRALFISAAFQILAFEKAISIMLAKVEIRL